MFDNIFHIIQKLEHVYVEENEVPVHSLACRRCAHTTRLNVFKGQIRKVLQDIDFAIGEPIEENKKKS
jgi:hypothetical protein